MRSFLEKIEVNTHDEFITLKSLGKEIKKRHEIPTKFNIEGFDFPLISGLINTRELLATSLGIKKNQIIKFISDKLENLKEYTRINNAPFLENKIEVKEDTKLDKFLPVIDFYADKKYTTSSIVIVKYPEENRQNASFHRMMYLGGNKFSIRIVKQRHLDRAYTDAMEKNNSLNVAIVFGVHPAIEITAAFSAPKLDELKLASAFLGGLNVHELPNGISVPANAEFVVEGKITKEMAEEGPFVDLTGTIDEVRQQPVLEVDNLYFRNNPIFRTILPGGNEHKMLMGVPQEPRMFKQISNTISTVKNVILTPGGCCWLHAVVQIKKRTEGDAKNTILAALAAHPSLKRVVVVDDDIDITNSNDVEWAISTRFQPDKDLLLVPNSKGSSLDPSSKNSVTCKWGLDATKPIKDNIGYNKVEF
ncbi:MAG: UbiD family decarboxylase [Promethearchaeota archaeon]